MIFLYFFITIIVIIGIYFAVELGVKHFDDKKSDRLGKDASASNIFLSPRADPVISTEEITTTLEPMVQTDQALIAEDPTLNREELISRFLNVLNAVKTEKQIQQILLDLKDIKYKSDLYESQKKIRRIFSTLGHYGTEITDTNSGLYNLDVHLFTIEDFINACPDKILINYCKKHKKVLDLDRVQYAIVATRKHSNPKKLN